jgi:hypothetical protein
MIKDFRDSTAVLIFAISNFSGSWAKVPSGMLLTMSLLLLRSDADISV